MNTMEHICVMCGHKEKEGIFLYDSFICDQCEDEMIHTEVEDEKYNFFIQQLKHVWLKNA